MRRLTDKIIQGLKATEARYEVRDGDGLAIRIAPTGSKTWVLFFDHEGKRSKMNLGTYPEISLKDARILASEQKKQIRKGVNPVTIKRQEQAKKAAEATVEDFAKIFIEKGVKAKGNRTWKEYQRNLDYDVLPAWGKRKVADIERSDVIDLVEKIHDRGAPNQSRQVFKIVRRMFNFAIDRGIIEHSPCYRVQPAAPEVKKTRTLTDDELRQFWAGLDKCVMSSGMARALKLILLTAQRPGEVIGAHKSEFDGAWWTIPAERSKNKRAHRVFLTETVKQLFIKHDFSDWLFPSPRGDKPIKVAAVSHALLRNLKPDPKGKTPPVLDMPQFTPHDLRRTAATNLAKLGYVDEVIGEVLNHTRTGVTSIYNRHRYDLEKQQALEAWERRLLGMLSERKTDNVVEFRKSRKK